jgi:hypothetical protein
MALAAMSTAATSAPSGPASSKDVAVTVFNFRDLLQARSSGTNLALHGTRLSLTSHAAPAQVTGQDHGHEGLVPLWTFQVTGARDGLNHVGAMLGKSPFTTKGTSRIPVIIIPMIVTTHMVAVSFDPKTGILGTAPGNVTLNSNAPDNTCLTAPNNVPSQLVYQSPIFQPASFTFGGTFVGHTQYIDAVQRASFFAALSGDSDNYHVLFDPVRIATPVVIDVPANEGLAITNGLLVGRTDVCTPGQILDFYWLDSYINGTLLPALASQGVNPGSVPLFLSYNTFLASPVDNLFTAGMRGYHYFAGEPTPSQLYVVGDFDATRVVPSSENTAELAHEMGELVNDPYTDNQVPPWGHTGQESGCAKTLEVGDPLSGTSMPPVTMPNGYTYSLQELTFFSWFFGGQSIGVNGWYSSNGTFLTDAGPACGD